MVTQKCRCQIQLGHPVTICYFPRSVFMEVISMDTLIIKIMNFAQKLVDADRASLFLVDAKTNQLYARIFDIQEMGVFLRKLYKVYLPTGHH